MTPSIWINEIVFSGGTAISCNSDDIIVIVGSNNVGKSATLRDILNKLNINSWKSNILQSVGYNVEGTLSETREFLFNLGRPVSASARLGASDKRLSAFGQTYDLGDLEKVWENSASGMREFTRIFCRLLSAGDRLNITNTAKNIAVTSDPLEHPAHWMIQDIKLEYEISEQFKKAFGADLVLHRAAGDKLPIHVGLRPDVELGEDRLDINYIKKIESLPLLEAQGDGMRGLAGVLLSIRTGKESILLLDEPEAFLHPPQARYLGQTLSQEAGKGKQVFIATHSGDVIRGILENKSSKIRIIRLQRDNNLNYAYELAPNDIAKLWNDPLLRYSNILDGLFHEKVIICESDSDARFYSAIADAIFDSSAPGFRKPDIMFTHCGGKDRIAVIVKALKAVGVPTAVIADFDVLNSSHPLKAIVEAANGDWKAIERDWKLVKQVIDSKKPDIDINQLKSSLISLANEITDQDSANRANKEIGVKFKQSSPWAIAKTTGSSSIPNGDPTVAYNRLLTGLKETGIFVVEVGELESFIRSVGNHGPKWVNSVLEKDLLNDSEFDAVKKFVSQIINVPEQKHFDTENPKQIEGSSIKSDNLIQGFWKDVILAQGNNTLAAELIAISFILSFIQEKISPIQSSNSIPYSSTDAMIYFNLLIMALCYIVHLGKRWAMRLFAFLFVLELTTALLDYKALFNHLPVLFSYLVNFLLQGYALRILRKDR